MGRPNQVSEYPMPRSGVLAMPTVEIHVLSASLSWRWYPRLKVEIEPVLVDARDSSPSTAELLEKGVRVKLIKRGYREGCGEVEDSIVKLSATLP